MTRNLSTPSETNFRNIMEFPKLFKNVKLITAEENYRSTQEILNFPITLLNMQSKNIQNIFHSQSWELPGIVSSANESMQSRFIVERVLELREESVP